MNEIEKMYKNAGVKKITLFKPKHSITLGDYDEEYVDYPPFTAEKQLELIKFLIKNYNYYLDVIDTNNFENSLGASLNDLWQALSEEEKQQVKGILE